MVSRRALAGLCVASLVAGATSLEEVSLEARFQEADRVVLGQVISTQTHAEQGDPRRMFTTTRILVGRHYKGAGPAELEVLQLGGRLGLWEARLAGDARFEVGETAVLFLRCPSRGVPGQWQKGACHLVGLGDGKLALQGSEVVIPSAARGQGVRRPFAEVERRLLAAARSAR